MEQGLRAGVTFCVLDCEDCCFLDYTGTASCPGPVLGIAKLAGLIFLRILNKILASATSDDGSLAAEPGRFFKLFHHHKLQHWVSASERLTRVTRICARMRVTGLPVSSNLHGAERSSA